MRWLRHLTFTACLSVLGLGALPAGATILPLVVSGGGIDLSRTCTSSSCGTAIWTDTSLWGATGTVTLDTAALTLSQKPEMNRSLPGTAWYHLSE